MRKRHSLILCILVFLFSLGLPLHAQQPTGSITGIVRDATGAVIPGAVVLLNRQQFGFNAGGPFLRDKLYWFVNYEQNNQDGAVGTQIGGFPQFSGTWPLPFDERMAMGRADWNLTPDSRFFFRFTHNFNDGVTGGMTGLGGISLSPFSNLKTVCEHAVIESAISSNRIEGVEIQDSRVGT